MKLESLSENNIFKKDEQVSQEALNPQEQKINQELLEEYVNKIEAGSDSNSFDISTISAEYLKPLILKLVGLGKASWVRDNLNRFKGLDKEVVDILVSPDAHKGSRYYPLNIVYKKIAKNIKSFRSEDHSDIASKLINSDNALYVLQNLDEFKGVDFGSDIASKLINSGNALYVLQNLDKFKGTDSGQIILSIIGSNYIKSINKSEIFNAVCNLQIIDTETATRLAEISTHDVMINLNKLKGFDPDVLASKIIDIGDGLKILDSLDKFQNLKLNRQTASKLIDYIKTKSYSDYYYDKIAEHISSFNPKDHEDIASNLIRFGQYQYVIRHSKKFNISKNQLILALAEGVIAGHFDLKRLFKIIFDEVSPTPVLVDTKFILNLVKASHNDILKNLDRFQIDEKKLVSEMIQSGHIQILAHYLKYFKNLEGEVANQLAEAGFANFVWENIDSFSNVDRFKLFQNTKNDSKIFHRSDTLRVFIEGGLDNPEVFRVILEKRPDIASLLNSIKEHGSLNTHLNRIRESPYDLLPFIDFDTEELTMSIEALRSNEFLVDAIQNNSNFGPRLVLEFPKFDKLSQENFQKLFTTKSRILKDNPDINTSSLEFRQKMQTELATYQRNPEITKELQDAGINLEQWLNFDEIHYFETRPEDAENFGDLVRDRFRVINKYMAGFCNIILEAVRDYKKDLENYTLKHPKADEIKSRINKMQRELLLNPEKAPSIEKGFNSLKNQLNSLPQIKAWHKLSGDIGNLKTKIKETEKLIASITERASAPEILKVKDQSTTLNFLFKKIYDDLPDLLEPLGSHKGAVLNQIEAEAGEKMDHIGSDLRAIEDFCSNANKIEKESRSYSISICSRDPDEDSYIGNYTDCCVRIDNNTHGSESPISDYLTDLGIQIIKLSDLKQKNKPVAALWCWIGRDKNNNVAFIVDNIEAVSPATIDKDIVERKLWDYVKKYAIAIDVPGEIIIDDEGNQYETNTPNIIQGASNNDLTLPFGSDQSDDNIKIGGSHRPGGAYLEAEMEYYQGEDDQDTDDFDGDEPDEEDDD